MSEAAEPTAATAERLAEALAPGLAPATVEKLLGSPRLGDRARNLLAGNTAAATMALPAEDRILAEIGAPGLDRAASLAGAVWNGSRVRALMLARDLQPFLDAHGPAAREAAFQLAALAPDTPAPLGASLPDQVREDGLACISAWIEALPPEAARAVRLHWPADRERPPGDAHRAAGPALLRALLPRLSGTPE